MSDPSPADLPIGTTLPELVDQYVAARTQRLALERQIDPIKEHEELLKKAVIAKMGEAKLDTVGTKMAIVKLKWHKEPVAQDWPKVWEYIRTNNAFDLLHRRLTVEAVRARWEEGVEVPGVGFTMVPKLTPSKPA